MAIYLLCLFNDAFNGFDYTISNNKQLVMIGQKISEFHLTAVSCKRHEEPRRSLNQNVSSARGSKPGPPEIVQYCAHKRNFRSVAVANFRVPKERFLEFNETFKRLSCPNKCHQGTEERRYDYTHSQPRHQRRN